ncbi:glycosyltransferase [Frigoribacterium sp. PhB24]|uniref:glycosyltransferase n=1 Tax=Frigoribacterium sp. PhB24 TaxID=2485204 RepID=UPI000FABBF2C|nr:glycosyltransferase [Frigoribacterium sp. PhB24]ROS51641.1 cellulose synthase/poly-beta-1,6-N-acetylglucosamine synthase-like glycosyltransferase [Frigoribacterium sp. PhB24]
MTSDPTLAAPGPVLTPTLPATPVTPVPNRDGVPSVPVEHVSAALPWVDWSSVQWAGFVLLAVLVALTLVVSIRRLVHRLYLVREQEELGRRDLDGPVLPSAHTFTALVPARGPAGLAVTLDLLARQQHPDVHVLAVVDADDSLTLDVATSAVRRHPGRVQVVETRSLGGRPATAASSLADGLAEVGDGVVGVFSAGDRPHPRLFALVDSVLTRTDADAVQHASRPALESTPWWAPRSAVDRWWWSRSVVRSHGRAGFVPLSDSTLFVRHSWLAWSGGWDATGVEAGLDLGVRMTVAGARVVIATSAETTTVERSPGGLRELMRVRATWVRGCLQVLGKRDWRRLRPKARRRALGVLVDPLLDAAVTVVTTVALLSTVLVGAPTLMIALALVPVLPWVLAQLLDVGATTEAAAEQGRRATGRERLLVVVGSVPDRLVGFAAVVAAVGTELATGRARAVGPSASGVPTPDGRPVGIDATATR